MRHAVGPLLSIDVGARTAETVDVDQVLERFVGGRGVATRLAHERIPFDADPLGPDNRLYLSPGPLQMSRMSFTGRMNATTISPLTGGLRSSNAGGYLSRNVADTGYCAVEVHGSSDELLAVRVSDEGVEFDPVPALSGATVSETSEYMAAEHGLGPEHLATVGPAGENRVSFASLMTYDHRAFGRGGLGAVLGSKHVKCVSFRGDSRPATSFPETWQEVDEAAATSDDPKRTQGTPATVTFLNSEFSLPTRYFREQSFEDAESISGRAVAEKKDEQGSCSACAFACKLPTRDEETGLETDGPEYETVFSLGSNCGVGDLVAVMKSNDLCDDLGLDTISAGDTIAAYLASEDDFGDTELIHELLEKIARRKGIGDDLARGVDAVADDLGVENWTSKGLEFPGHDGRVLHGQGLAYATSNSGADHMYSKVLSREYGELDPETLEGKPAVVVRSENRAALEDSGIVCAFSGDEVGRREFEDLFEADYTDLLDVGARVVTLERHFNNRRGFDRADDTVPFEDQLPGFDEALTEYYETRGWNDDGTVPEERVEWARVV